MPLAKLTGVEIQYRLAGSGPALLVISGSGGDLRVPPSIFDSPLASHFELLAYDQRGQGRSSLPPGPYSMEDFANDAAMLIEHVGWPRCHVLGTSFGGMVAQELAIRRGDLVDRLVLACTSSGGAGGASYPLQLLTDLPEPERAVTMYELADVRRDATWRAENPERLAALLAIREKRIAYGEENPDLAKGNARQLAARAQHDTYERLGKISALTFVAGGRHDGIAPPANIEQLQSAIPNSQMAFFEGGHGFLHDDPAAYLAVIQFLTEVR